MSRAPVRDRRISVRKSRPACCCPHCCSTRRRSTRVCRAFDPPVCGGVLLRQRCVLGGLVRCAKCAASGRRCSSGKSRRALGSWSRMHRIRLRHSTYQQRKHLGAPGGWIHGGCSSTLLPETVVRGAALVPNNSFKPNLLRYTKAMAERACHGFGSTTQVGLTQQLGIKEKLMAIRIFAILFSIFSLATFAHAQEGTLERSDWRKFFSEFQAKGTIVVADERQADRAMLVFDPVRSKKRYSPASTFKIPHTLFALDAGAVRDEFQIFRWDGVNRGFAGHNQDQDLRSAMRNSTVWVYELFAKEIGDDKARRYLKKIDYGNAVPSTSNGDYWIEGSLAISAQEQIAFLRKLYRNELPFRVEHQRLVKDLMIVEAGRNWILRAKTGWEGRMGWWVGWVEWPTGSVFFALNIDTPNRMDDLFKREAIVRAILRSIEALPPNPAVNSDAAR
ncbi:Beta-lactamase OXA-2 [Pseudomonas aeruginosa]|nr:Beta-lactamase OXA-2 [Pseudomonas aeruginosa]